MSDVSFRPIVKLPKSFVSSLENGENILRYEGKEIFRSKNRFVVTAFDEKAKTLKIIAELDPVKHIDPMTGWVNQVDTVWDSQEKEFQYA